MQYNERIKRQIETKEERCTRIEEQMKRANEEAARKYREYLKEHTDEMTHTSDKLRSTSQHNVTSGTVITAKHEAGVKYNQVQQEQFMQTMYSGMPIRPHVEASNQRALDYVQKRRAAKEYAEHYAENRERDVQRAIKLANDKAKKVFASMPEAELKQYTADMATIKLGNEQRTQKQMPKAIREHRMSPEAYARHVAKQREKHKDPEYRARLQQQKKDKHMTHGKTTVIPLAPMPTITGPLKPPCSN